MIGPGKNSEDVRATNRLILLNGGFKEHRGVRVIMIEKGVENKLKRFREYYSLTILRIGADHLGEDYQHLPKHAHAIDSPTHVLFVEEAIFPTELKDRVKKIVPHYEPDTEQIEIVLETVIREKILLKRIEAYMTNVLQIPENTDGYSRLSNFISELVSRDAKSASRLLMNSYKILQLEPGHSTTVNSRMERHIEKFVLPEHEALCKPDGRLQDRVNYVQAQYEYLLISNPEKLSADQQNKLVKFLANLSIEPGHVQYLVRILLKAQLIMKSDKFKLPTPPKPRGAEKNEVKTNPRLLAFFFDLVVHPVSEEERCGTFIKINVQSTSVPFDIVADRSEANRCKALVLYFLVTMRGIDENAPHFQEAKSYLFALCEIIPDAEPDAYKHYELLAQRAMHIADIFDLIKGGKITIHGMIVLHVTDILADVIKTLILPGESNEPTHLPAEYFPNCIGIDIRTLLSHHSNKPNIQCAQEFFKRFLEIQHESNAKYHEGIARLVQLLPQLSIEKDRERKLADLLVMRSGNILMEYLNSKIGTQTTSISTDINARKLFLQTVVGEVIPEKRVAALLFFETITKINGIPWEMLFEADMIKRYESMCGFYFKKIDTKRSSIFGEDDTKLLLLTVKRGLGKLPVQHDFAAQAGALEGRSNLQYYE